MSSLQYSVRIVNQKKGTDTTIQVPNTKFILDSAEEQSVLIPYSCRAGSCSTCLGILKEGKVDQSGNIFLNDKQVDDGYILTCVAIPLSDVVVEVDVEEQFYNMNPDMKI